jgi:TolB-like protein/Flp pilus assembly protein TadD
MPDIFISYSRKDSEQAELLTQLLASAGLSVWIDHSSIGAATSWSGEISKAITDCTALIVLLSPSSVDSKNVTREVALAFERNKKILPIDIEPVILPDDFAYHLAGLQRSSMANIDSVIRALSKLGLEATGAPQAPKFVKESDGRKSLMVLPFEDLSPTGDNGWFADGIASELISTLSKVKALRVADPQATKEFKSYRGQLPVYAKEMSIQYFVQGDVRKFGDSIKITCRLLDIESGDFLWQDSLKGTMNDVFEIQEEVAMKVSEGLHLILTSEEKKKLAERGTENAEAYELYLKGNEYFVRNTKEGYQLAAQLNSEAIRLDPTYVVAYTAKANALSALYETYDRDPALLEEALRLITEALRLKPDFWKAYAPLSMVYMLQGKWEEAERTAKEYIRKAPEDHGSHFALGYFYSATDQNEKAIAPSEEAARLQPSLTSLWNIVVACHSAREETKRKEWARAAIPMVEKHLKLFPDDESQRVHHAVLLHLSGRDDDAKAAAQKLSDIRDGNSLMNAAALLCELKDYSSSISTLRKAMEAGYRNMRNVTSFLEDKDTGLGSLQGTPEWEAIWAIADKIEAEEKGHA